MRFLDLSKGATSTIFYTFGMVRSQDLNPQPPAPKADALPTELWSWSKSIAVFLSLHTAIRTCWHLGRLAQRLLVQGSKKVEL